MAIKQSIDQDLKSAMLGGDKTLVTTLRSLKSAILYAEVAKGVRDQGLGDPEIIDLLSKEAKKRQESAELYRQGGDEGRAQAELTEKRVIEGYLPAQLSDEELLTIIDEVAQEAGDISKQTMGKIIADVKQRAAGRADGGRIAQAVKAKLS